MLQEIPEISMDRLLQIETFIAAVEHASFSDAARELKVTPAMMGYELTHAPPRQNCRIDRHVT